MATFLAARSSSDRLDRLEERAHQQLGQLVLLAVVLAHDTRRLLAGSVPRAGEQVDQQAEHVLGRGDLAARAVRLVPFLLLAHRGHDPGVVKLQQGLGQHGQDSALSLVQLAVV